jgi:hypothetical protein
MANEEDIHDDIDTILRYCGFAGANDMALPERTT